MLFRSNGLLSHIEKIFTSAEVGSSKHSPEIYDAEKVAKYSIEKIED